jgi:hypothetical protein
MTELMKAFNSLNEMNFSLAKALKSLSYAGARRCMMRNNRGAIACTG